MSELRLSRPTISGSGGTAAKVISAETGALVAGVPKTVFFSTGIDKITFPDENYVLQVQDVNNIVLVDSLVKGNGIDSTENKSKFTITVLVDLPAGLTVVAIGS